MKLIREAHASRTAAYREECAQHGRFGGGIRPYGYMSDGETVEAFEAEQIRSWAAQVQAGVPPSVIAADLQARGVPTVRGGRWDGVTIRDVLLSPRVAGLAVHRVRQKSAELREAGSPVPYDVGVVGKGRWPAILPEATWRAVAEILTSPRRAPRWLGSLVYRCGPCRDAGVEEYVTVNGPRTALGPSYGCRNPAKGHLRRAQAPVDGFIEELMERRLALPDLGAPDGAWALLPLGSKQQLVQTLMTVTLLRGRPGRKPISPELRAHQAQCGRCAGAASRRKWNEGCPEGVRLHRDAYFESGTIHIEWR